MQHDHSRIAQSLADADDAGLDASTASDCGALAVGCTTAAGQIADVTDEMAGQLKALDKIELVVESLERDQEKIAESTEEAKLFSARAREQLAAGKSWAANMPWQRS